MRAAIYEKYLFEVYVEFDSYSICDTKDLLQSELNTDQVKKNWI